MAPGEGQGRASRGESNSKEGPAAIETPALMITAIHNGQLREWTHSDSLPLYLQTRSRGMTLYLHTRFSMEVYRHAQKVGGINPAAGHGQ